MTLTFKIDSLQVEGSVTLAPEVITDQTTFSPSCSERACDEAQGAMASPSARANYTFPLKGDLHEQIESTDNAEVLAFFKKFLELLKSLGLLKG